MGSEHALETRGLSKAYRIYAGPMKRIVEGLTLGRVRGHHEFWALRDVNLSVKPGGSVGLCGANGAGKSTLLKVLAGTTAPTAGGYRIRGRVASLLELGAGFHLDFTGRANIVMNGVMMGLSRQEIAARMDEIVEFAELGPYIDEPVRTYSSGMGLRLGFSVAVAVDPDVLIIDEVFAVGDMYFQKKCVDKIYDFKRRNKTILFCSHSLYDVRQLCDEALWIDKGLVMAQGDSVHVTNEYSAFQRHHIREGRDVFEEFPLSPEAKTRSASELPTIRDARIYRLGTDEETYKIETGDSIEFRVWWANPRPHETPIQIGVGFMRQDMTTCGGMSTQFDRIQLSGREGCLRLQVPELQLLSGQFLVPVVLMDERGVHKYQEYLLPENLTIRSHTYDVGLVRMAHSWVQTHEPVPETRAPAAPPGVRAP